MILPEDEYRHAAPPRATHGLWGDTLWVSVVDPAANIFGCNHFHLTNQGFGRFEALYVIDGVVQQWGNKVPLVVTPDGGPWSDGRLTYTVVRPLEEIRITFDGPVFGFEQQIRTRLPGNALGVAIAGCPYLGPESGLSDKRIVRWNRAVVIQAQSFTGQRITFLR